MSSNLFPFFGTGCPFLAYFLWPLLLSLVALSHLLCYASFHFPSDYVNPNIFSPWRFFEHEQKTIFLQKNHWYFDGILRRWKKDLQGGWRRLLVAFVACWQSCISLFYGLLQWNINNDHNSVFISLRIIKIINWTIRDNTLSLIVPIPSPGNDVPRLIYLNR